MACPLAALASIATLAAEAEEASASARRASAASVSDSSAPAPSSKSKPTKKRPAPTAASAAKAPPKKKRTRGPSKKKRRSASASAAKPSPSHPRNNNNHHATPFPATLLGILTAPHNGECISFLSDDASFVVVHPDMLERNVLPLHAAAFGKDEGEEVRFAEFVEMLERWGFESTKDPKYPEVNVYRHPLFRKGDWESCLKMTLPGDDAKKKSEEEEIAAAVKLIEDAMSKREAGRAAAGREAGSRSGAPEEGESAPPPARPAAKSSRAAKPAKAPRKARSVTPPEANSRSPSSDRPPSNRPPLPGTLSGGTALRHFQAGFGGANATLSRIVRQGRAWEETIAATARTRQRLSGAGLGLGIGAPTLGGGLGLGAPALGGIGIGLGSGGALAGLSTASLEQMALRNQLELRALSMGSSAPLPSSLGPLAPSRPTASLAAASSMLAAARAPVKAAPAVPTDAEVRRATDDVVSAAVAALRPGRPPNGGPQRPFRYPPAPAAAPVAAPAVALPPPSASGGLDAMTAVFLEQSALRAMRSRPVGLHVVKSAAASGLSDKIDRQSRALLATQRGGDVGDLRLYSY